jgi:hypothetical protein
MNLKEFREQRRVTFWFRTRFQAVLNSVEICVSRLTDIEPVAGRSWKAVELC